MKGGEKAKAAILKKNSFKQRKSKALAETADELAAELLEIIYVA
jgi:seryl-tRNA synthetase